mgnify:FL=1
MEWDFFTLLILSLSLLYVNKLTDIYHRNKK